jgi:hypothetical protein
VQRYGNLIWLTLMPIGDYVASGGSGSILYRASSR